jgi:Fe-S oxidoreductase
MTKLKVTPKLEFVKVKPITKTSHLRYCSYCQREQNKTEDFFKVISSNIEIFKFFHQYKLGSARCFFLCSECFQKLHQTLEEIEEEGYEVLDPDSDEFKDLDEDQGNSSGR